MGVKTWTWFAERSPCFASTRWRRTATAQQSPSGVTLRDRLAVGWNCSHSMIIQQLMGHSVSEMTTYIFQLAEGQEWVLRNKAWRLSRISFIWNYRSTFILINFDLCPGKLICVGYIIGFSGLQLSVASRDPRQKIRTKVRSMCLSLWLFSCEFTLN